MTDAHENLNCVVKLYADDEKLYSLYKLGDNSPVLVKAIDHVAAWAKYVKFELPTTNALHTAVVIMQ